MDAFCAPCLLLPALSACTLLVVMWGLFSFKRRQGMPPQAPHILPWFGNIYSMLTDPVSWPARMHDKLGDVFTTTALGYSVTYLRGQPNITAFAKGSTRGLDSVAAYKRVVEPVAGQELFLSNLGEVQEALDIRRLDNIQPALFQFTRTHIRQTLRDRVPSSGWSDTIALQSFMNASIFRMVCFCLLSPEVAISDGDYISERMLAMDLKEDFASFLIPWETEADRARVKGRSEVVACVARHALDRITRLLGEDVDESPDDFMGYIIYTTWTPKQLRSASKADLEGFARKVALRTYVLFFAGFLPTVGRGAWAFQDLLTKNPAFFERIRSDNDRLIEDARLCGPDAAPRVEEHDFLYACITESIRMHPVGAWLRWAEKPFLLPGNGSAPPMLIPRGFVAVTTEAIGLNPTVYSEPNDYNPARYFSAPFVARDDEASEKEFIRLDHVRSPPMTTDRTLQPSFGVGARQCPGRLFAYRMIATFMSALLESFELEPVETEANKDGKHDLSLSEVEAYADVLGSLDHPVDLWFYADIWRNDGFNKTIITHLDLDPTRAAGT
ncbi:hypothetical protein BOTBODRAFT_186783 [Botryobasidium botryosum FD-172 SS1]|uniref:Cytochrome P450 n=1 Tax=Botryobasidium botryosum (strain FD-172 SS1) TaxID=930990 RepID=A0A067MMY9_BOTB1|nr:hypothetical protein BOTBODRAFT_186783 [Botryobasidium botryosum FD-172 SS1]